MSATAKATRRRSGWVILLLTLGLLFAIWISVGLGSRQGQVRFDPAWPARLGRADGMADDVLRLWRGPRVLAALLVGAALATAGLLLQGVTRNPLADPYLLGVSGGAGLFVVVLQAMLPAQSAWWAVPLAAFAGAALAMLVVLRLARGGGGRISVLSLILAGVVVNAFCAAVISFLLARFDPFHLRVTTTWLYGGIGFTRWSQLAAVGGVIVAGWLYARMRAHQLNAFALGVEGAAGVGVDAERLLQRTALLASLLAALGVSLSGLLGYVGLIVPHAVRLVVGRDLRHSLPTTALAGSLLLLLADTAARLVLAPEELPVGVLTALLGCPVLLWQLRLQLRGAAA